MGAGFVFDLVICQGFAKTAKSLQINGITASGLRKGLPWAPDHQPALIPALILKALKHSYQVLTYCNPLSVQY